MSIIEQKIYKQFFFNLGPEILDILPKLKISVIENFTKTKETKFISFFRETMIIIQDEFDEFYDAEYDGDTEEDNSEWIFNNLNHTTKEKSYSKAKNSEFFAYLKENKVDIDKLILGTIDFIFYCDKNEDWRITGIGPIEILKDPNQTRKAKLYNKN